METGCLSSFWGQHMNQYRAEFASVTAEIQLSAQPEGVGQSVFTASAKLTHKPESTRPSVAGIWDREIEGGTEADALNRLLALLQREWGEQIGSVERVDR